MRTCVPTIAGSPPNSAVQPVWLSTTKGGALTSAAPSSRMSTRRARGADAKHLKVVARHHRTQRQPSVDARDDASLCECGREHGGFSAEFLVLLPGEPMASTGPIGPGELEQ